MKPFSTPMLIALGLVVGLGCGFLSGTSFQRYISNQIILGERMSEHTHSADVALRTLKLTRADSTNTVSFLENELDDQIVEIASLVGETPASEQSVLELPMLAKVRDYRTQFPHKSDQAGRDNEITHALALAVEKP